MQTDYKIIIDGEEIPNCGELAWNDDIETIASEFSFVSTSNITTGAKVLITNKANKEILRGIITDKKINTNKTYTYSGFDFGFYLNKNEVIIQFNNVKIDTAIKQLCAKVNVPCGNICAINAYVTKIFKDVVVSDIIIELLEMATKKTGAKYVFSCQCGKLEIVNTMEAVNDEIELTQGQIINIADTLSNIQYSESIQDLVNSVTLVDDNDKSTYVVASAKDDDSIGQYGLLGQIESIDKDDKTSKNIVASNILAEKNKIKKSINVDMLGADTLKKGCVLTLNYPDFNIDGDFYTKSTSHAVKNKAHMVSAELIEL